MVEYLTDIDIVLRSKHHCLLFIPNLLRWGFLAHISPDFVTRIWTSELAFRHSRRLYYRYIRAAKSSSDYFPTHVNLHVLHRLQLLDTKGHHAYHQSRLHISWYLPLWRCLFTGRRSGAIHLFSRSLPTICSDGWYVPRHFYDLVLQLRSLNYLAQSPSCFYHTRRLLLVRRLEHCGVLPGAPVHARNEGQDARGIGPGILSTDTYTCRIRFETNSVLLQALFATAAR